MNRVFFATLIYLGLSSSVGASGGGNGVRNGGGVVQCVPGFEVASLEYFEASREFPSIAFLPKDTNPIPEVFRRLDHYDPRLARRLEMVLNEFEPLGESPHGYPFGSMWELGDGPNGFTRLLNDLRRQHPDYVFDRRFADWAPILDFQLSEDLPENCRYFQVLMFDGVSPRLWADRRVFEGLSLMQSRLLALHEALYAIGFGEFGHQSSRLTRKLIVAMMGEIYGRGSSIVTHARIDDFRKYRERRARFESRNSLRGSPGIYRSSGENGRCPVYARIEFDGVDGAVETGVYLDQERREIRLHFSKLTRDAWEDARRVCAFHRISDPNEVAGRGFE